VGFGDSSRALVPPKEPFDTAYFGEGTLASRQPKELLAGQGAMASFGWPYKEPGMPTLDTCREAIRAITWKFGGALSAGYWYPIEKGVEVYEKMGTFEADALLSRFGVKRLKDLWIGQYEAFCLFAGLCIRTSTPPSSSKHGESLIQYIGRRTEEMREEL
jgi:hypothetical protein